MPLTRNFILRQLERVQRERGLRVEQKYAWIRCIYHGSGRERTPSLRVHLDRSTEYRVGSYYCFGCGEHGEWNDLARPLKIRRYKQSSNDDFDLEISDTVRQTLLGETVAREHDLAATIKFSPRWPRRERWRSIPGWLINKLDGRMINTRYGERLYLPVKIDNEMVAGITCTLHDKAQRKYIYDAGKWLQTALFPFDHVKRMVRRRRRHDKPVVIFLVEGPRDALRLLSYGIMALAILGGKTVWRNAKAELLLSLEPDTVVLAFDPDKIGRAVTQLAKHDLHGQVRLKQLKFRRKPTKQDPGNMPEWRITRLKRQLQLN